MAIQMRFLGHSGFEITTAHGGKILIDPFISQYEHSPFKIEDFKEVQYILVTHGAFDHMGDSIAIAKNTGALLCCGVEVARHAMNLGIPAERIFRMVWGTTYPHPDFEVRAVEAHHISFFKTEGGQFLSGQGNSFVVSLFREPQPPLRIYHTGDTSIFSDLRLFGNLYKPDIGLICMGGLQEIGPKELDPYEASLVAEWLGVKKAIPMHYRRGSSYPEDFKKELQKRAPHIQVTILNPGDTLEVG